MYKLLIPSAKIVSEELQSIGKLPPIIYPVNDKIVFDHLLEQYKDVCSDIRVICYENMEKVHRRLATYHSEVLNVIDLSVLGDLGYTIYSGLHGIEGAVIINFADTIVLDKIQDIEGNCFFCAHDDVSEKWTFFEEEQGRLFVGVFKLTDADFFKYCLERVFQGDVYHQFKDISTFYSALMLYSQSYPLQPVITSNWFDIGHLDRYYNTQLEVKAREFNHITIDRDRGILRKTSDDREKFIGEILWYLKLPSDIEYVRPRIFSYSVDYNNPYVNMEYYSYHTLHELFLYGDLTSVQWKEIFNRIRFVCKDFKRYTVKDFSIKASLEEMYLKKTLTRLDMLRKNECFAEFFTNEIIINGISYVSLDIVGEKLKETIPRMLYDIDTFSIIHGDLCFSNIMADSKLSFVKVIDPRGKFGLFDIYGDTRYELAKLFHSVDGKYDFLIKDLFDIEFDTVNCRINYKIRDRVRDYDLYQIFLKVFKDEIGDDLQKIELIEALLFLSMIPLHGESIQHQMAMLGTGLDILGRVIKITVEERD